MSERKHGGALAVLRIWRSCCRRPRTSPQLDRRAITIAADLTSGGSSVRPDPEFVKRNRRHRSTPQRRRVRLERVGLLAARASRTGIGERVVNPEPKDITVKRYGSGPVSATLTERYSITPSARARSSAGRPKVSIGPSQSRDCDPRKSPSTPQEWLTRWVGLSAGVSELAGRDRALLVLSQTLSFLHTIPQNNRSK
jgi:hypothetical protein